MYAIRQAIAYQLQGCGLMILQAWAALTDQKTQPLMAVALADYRHHRFGGHDTAHSVLPQKRAHPALPYSTQHASECLLHCIFAELCVHQQLLKHTADTSYQRKPIITTLLGEV